MKKGLLTFAIVFFQFLIVFDLIGQGFEKHYSTKYSCGIGPVIELDSCYIIITNRYSNVQGSGFHPYDLMVYKISLDGNFLDSLNIYNNDSAVTYCMTAKIVGSSIVTFATLLNTNTGGGEGVLLSFDFDLHLTKQIAFDLPADYSLIFSFFVDTDSTYYISGNNFIPNFNGSPFIIKLTDSGKLLKTVLLNDPEGRNAVLLYIPIKDEFRLTTTQSIWYLSRDLQSDSLVWQSPGNDTINVYDLSLPKLINDTSYVTTGLVFAFDQNGEVYIEIGFVNRSIDTTIHALHVFDEYDTSNQVNPWSFDFIDSDSIFISCNSNVGSNWLPIGVGQDVWITIYNVRSDGTINWKKRYGQNADYVWPRLCATRDQGCLIACERYDWQQLWPNYKTDLYLIKTDRFGNSSSVGINDMLPTEKAIVFQDLINNQLVVQLEQTAILRLYDVSGRLVYENNLISGFTKISTNHFKAGMYLYSLYNKAGFLSSGKVLMR